MLVYALNAIFSRRRDARRRLASVVSNGVPKIFLTWFAIFCRLRGKRRHDALRRFASIVSNGTRGSYAPSVASFSGVATFGVGFPSPVESQKHIYVKGRLLAASIRLASAWQNRAVCHLKFSITFVSSLESASRWMSSRHEAPFCQNPV
jgi:hypothetical protein